MAKKAKNIALLLLGILIVPVLGMVMFVPEAQPAGIEQVANQSADGWEFQLIRNSSASESMTPKNL